MSIVEKSRVIVLGLLVSSLGAYWISVSWPSVPFSLAFLLCSASVGLTVWIVMRSWITALKRAGDRFQGRIASLTVQEARQRATELLGDERHYKPTKRLKPLPSADLPPSLADVFVQFELIQDSTGNQLSLGPSSGGFVQAGLLEDEVRLLVRLSDGAVFEVWPDQEGPGEKPDYPSFYHWLVINAEG